MSSELRTGRGKPKTADPSIIPDSHHKTKQQNHAGVCGWLALIEVIKMQMYLTVTSSKATLAFVTFILAGAMRSASAFVVPGAGLGMAFRSARGAATGLVRMQATEEMGL